MLNTSVSDKNTNLKSTILLLFLFFVFSRRQPGCCVLSFAVSGCHTFGCIFIPPAAVVKPRWIYDLIILISTLAFFLLPMLVISILYLLIGLRLHRERELSKTDNRCSFGPESLSTSHKQKLSKRNVQVTKMLCRWLPQSPSAA